MAERQHPQVNTGKGCVNAWWFVKLTIDLQHNGGLLCVTVGVRGLAAVDAGVLDDGIINDEPGS